MLRVKKQVSAMASLSPLKQVTKQSIASVYHFNLRQYSTAVRRDPRECCSKDWRLISPKFAQSHRLSSESKEKTNYTTSCWKCHSHLLSASLFCDTCGVIQPVKIGDTDPIDLYKLFELDIEFNIDNLKLDTKFKELQSVLHPDKFSMHSLDEQNASLETSSTVNQGYQILKNKVDRADYLSKMVFGIDASDESQSNKDLTLMSEIFELRESIEDNADDFTSLTNQLNELKSNTEDVCKQLEENLSRHNIKDFARNALRLKYYSKTIAELEDMLD